METESQASIDATLPSSDDASVGGERAPAERIGRYIVLARIGQGAMGVVYAAYDAMLDRKVAVKLLHRDQSRQGRLQREAQAMAKVSHQNVAHVYEVGLHGEQLYLSMEFIDGQPLSAWLSVAERTQAEILDVFAAAGRGLAAAHQAGLVHRDFKPDNVLVDGKGRPRVLDFGLARAATELESAAPIEREAAPEASSSVLASAPDGPTLSGAVLGTPGYMAAEQFAGKPATALSDQFAFCVALWRALCRMRPYRGENPMALAFAVQTGQLQPMPSHAKVSKPLRRALERGLSTDPADRWPTMDALLQAIERSRTRTRRIGIGVAALALLGGGAAATVALSNRDDPCASASTSMDEFWTSKRRRDVRQALSSAAPGYGTEVARSVDGTLEGYAASWRALAQGACLATHEERTQSEYALELQYECLGRRFSAFETIVGELRGADELMLSRAVEAVASLPSIEACSDTAELVHAYPPPDDPDRAAESRRLRAEISAAHGVLRLGRIEDAEQRLGNLDEEVAELAYPPATSEWTMANAELIEQTEGADRAQPAMLAAFRAAVEARDTETAWRSARQLAEIVGYRQGQSEAGLQWVEVARSYLPSTPREHDLALASLEGSIGVILYRKGDIEEGKQHKLEALRLQDEWGDAYAAAETLGDIAVFDVALGNVEEGRDLTLRSLDKKVEVLGPSHPLVGVATQNLAAATEKLGDDDGAMRLFERAAEIAEQTRGRGHPAYSIPMVHLADIEYRRGEVATAKERAESALGYLRESGGEALNVYRPLDLLCRIALDEGALEDAEQIAVEGEEILRASPPKHPLVAQSKLRLAQVRTAQGRLTDARRHLAEALEVAEQIPTSSLGAEVRLAMAELEWLEGNEADAREHGASALAALEGVHGAAHVTQAVERWLAEHPADPK